MFWPRTQAFQGFEVRFNVGFDGRGGVINAPLIFVDNVAAHDPKTMRDLVRYYHDLPPTLGYRTGVVSGAPLRFAPEVKPGSCSFETARVILGARGRFKDPEVDPGFDQQGFEMDAAMEGADQPPFYPYAVEAHVNLKSVQRFIQRPSQPIRVSYDPDFRDYGFTPGHNPAYLYLAVHGWAGDPPDWFSKTPDPVKMGMGDRGERSGAVATPASVLIGMSRDKGPVGGAREPTPPLPSTDLAAGCLPPPAPPLQMIFDAFHNVVAAPAAPAPPPPPPPASPPPAPTGARAGMFDPLSFFHADAKLLGLISLREVLIAALYAAAPELVEELSAAEADVEQQLDTLTTELNTLVDSIGDWAAGPVTTLTNALDTLEAGLKQPIASGAPPGASSYPSLGQLYPTLPPRIDAARTATAQLAQDLTSSDDVLTKLQAIARDVHAVNDALGALVGELDRIAANPLPANVIGVVNALHGFVAALDPVKLRGALVAAATSDLQAAAQQVLGGQQPDIAAIVFGPDFADLKQPPPAIDWSKPETLQPYLKSMAQGLAYEAIGRPVAQAFMSVQALTAEAVQASGLPAKLLAVAGQVMDALDSVAQAPILLEKLGDNACTKVATFLNATFIDPATALLAEAADLDGFVQQLEKLLADAAAVESDAERQVQQFADANGAAADLGAIKAAATAFSQFRLGLGSGVDRLKDSLTSIERERTELKALADTACAANHHELLACASRLSVVRLRAIDAVRTIFSRVSGTLASQPAQLAGLPTAARDIWTKQTEHSRSALSQSANLLPLLTSLRLGPNAAEASNAVGVATIAARGDALAQEAQSRLDDITGAINGLIAGEVAQIASQLIQIGDGIGSFATERERSLIGLMASATALEADYASRLETGLLTSIHTLVHAIGSNIYDPLVGDDGLLTKLGSAIDLERATLALILKSDVLNALDFSNDPNDSNSIVTQLSAERTTLLQVEGAGDLATAVSGLRDYASSLKNGQSALGTRFAQLSRIFDNLSRGRLDQIIDLPKIRNEIAQALIEAALPSITLSYTLRTHVRDLAPFFFMNRTGTPPRDPRMGDDDLVLKFRLDVNPLQASQSRMTATGDLQPFEVQVFDVITLDFNAAHFTAVSGQDSHLDLKVASVTLGPAVDFLSALSAWMSPGGSSGFYIHPQLAPPGIEAGFAVGPFSISLGEVSFINVSLGASVVLPFDDRPALFKFNLATRQAPFLIVAMPYGGGGFVSLISDSKSIVGFEAAFEYGAMVAFSYGPLSAIGRVMTGIYVARLDESAIISGFFVAEGSAHIACFGIDACLTVSISQADGGAIIGSATFTFTFSIALASISFSVGVTKTISQGWGAGGASSGGQQSSNDGRLGGTAARFIGDGLLQQADYLEGVSGVALIERRRPPTISTAGVGMTADWSRYQAYFDNDL